MGGLSNLLNEKKKPEQKSIGTAAPKKEAEKPAEKKDEWIPKRLQIKLADGTVLKRDELKPCERQRRDYIMRNDKGQIIKRKPRTVAKYPPAPVYTPDWLIPPPNPDEGLTDKQKEYKKNFVTSEDLRKPTPKKTKSNNRLGWNKYLFWAELKANKNGLLYYSVPTILNIVFLLLNVAVYNFWVNAALTALVVINYYLMRYAIKNYDNVLAKVGLVILILAVDVGLLYLARIYLPEYYAQIYLPFTLKLILIYVGLTYFLGFYAGVIKVYYDDLKADDGNVVKVMSGPPRVGKTALAVQMAYVLALMKWRKLQFEYWKIKSLEKQILKRNNKDELLERRRIINSYSFYTMSPCIPCLFSNIGIQDKDGRAAHVVTLDHMRGIEALPLYPVIVFDEIGACITMDEGMNRGGAKEKPVDISDMMRLGGQFLRWTVICTEQDYNHIYIDVRRVVGQNIVITSREWRCKPKLLFGIYKFLYMLKSDGLDKTVKKQPFWANFLDKFERYVYSIGFAVTRFGYRNNTQTSGKISEKDSDGNVTAVKASGSRWIPVRNVCKYDHEAMRQLYPSYFDKEYHIELHKSLFVNGGIRANYQYVSKTKSLDEKREVLWTEYDKIA